MLIDAKTLILTTGGSEALATNATTAVTSDYIDFKAAGYSDGGGDLFLTVRCVSTTAAAGTYFDIQITDATTSGGTYTARATKRVLLAEAVASTVIANIPFPMDMKQYMRVTITPSASMTGILTVNAAVTTQ